MEKLTELAVYILKQEFPQLSLTEDTDIEQYFQCRAANRQADALDIYNTKIRRKYPDDKIRVLLLTYYRRRDYRFSILLTQSLIALAEKTILQIKKVILFFVKTITPLKDEQAYTVINTCEKVINAISSDRFAAINFSEKYVRYAEKLIFYHKDMKLAADILRKYVTGTMSSVRDFREQQRTIIESKRQVEYNPQAGFDFSKVAFSKEQIEAITIPAAIVRTEDKVLAYSFKYWNSYDDSAFENIVLLYSRKYATNHYAIFESVRKGRLHGWKDEEILHAVLANVSKGYYYNVGGDLYLQRAWRMIRAKMLPEPTPHAEEIQKSTTQKRKRQPKKNIIEKKVKKTRAKPIKQQTIEEVPTISDELKVEMTTVNSTQPQTIVSPSSEPKIAAVLLDLKYEQPPAVNHADAHVFVNKSSVLHTKEPKSIPDRSSIVQPVIEVLDKQSVYIPDKPDTVRLLSVAEMIKRSVGGGYAVYRDLFFKTIRSSIRALLAKNTVQRISLFRNGYNNAEKIIYTFFEEAYNNPYQQWQGSEAQKAVLSEGFHLDSLEPIIRHWAEHHIS